MSEPTAPPSTPGTGQDDGASWVHVAEMKDLARRKRKQVEVRGCPIALFLVDDEVFAVDDVCIHQERSLAKGTLLNGQVICPGHQWKFDPRTGRARGPGRLPGHLRRAGHRGGRRPRRPRAGHSPPGDQQRVVHPPRRRRAR